MQSPAMSTRIAIRSMPVLLIAGLLAWLATPLSFATAQQSDLVGAYAVNIVKDDVPENVAYGPSVIGQWQISFNSDGSYTMTRADVGQLVSGSYKVNGDQVTLTDESGLLSCSDVVAANDPSADVSTGVYTWKIEGERLALTSKDDGCNTRKLILTTRELDHFVSCQTPGGSEAAAASPVASPEASAESDLSALAVKQEAATPAATATTAVEKGIDDLLAQLTACWATGDPARFLPLLTDEYAQSLLNAGQSQDDLLRNLATAMGVPITYQRAGDVTIIDDTHASAIVRTSNGEQEQFTRFRFALVDGDWKLDGPA